MPRDKLSGLHLDRSERSAKAPQNGERPAHEANFVWRLRWPNASFAP